MNGQSWGRGEGVSGGCPGPGPEAARGAGCPLTPVLTRDSMMRSFRASVSPCFILMRFLSRHFMAYLPGSAAQSGGEAGARAALGALAGKTTGRDKRVTLRDRGGRGRRTGRGAWREGERLSVDTCPFRALPPARGAPQRLASPSGSPPEAGAPVLTSCPCRPCGTRRPHRSPLAR